MSCDNNEAMRTRSLYMSDRVYQILKTAGRGNASRGVKVLADLAHATTKALPQSAEVSK